MSASSPSTLRRLTQPRLVGLTLLALLAVVGTVLAGFWQLGVYDSRQADERAAQQAVPTVPLSDVLGPDDAFTGTANNRPVIVQGRYAPADQQFWVSGREHGDRTGYWVVAPFLVGGLPTADDGRPAALLVVRGWSPDNTELPQVPGGDVRLRAVLQPGEAAEGNLDASRTAAAIRIPLLVGELPYDLYSGFALATSQSPAGPASLVAVTPPVVEVSWTAGLRNLAYALQWWVFGAFAIFMWWRMSHDILPTPTPR